MTARWRAILVALSALNSLSACGDDLHPIDLFTASSGSRLALQKYRYEDGTEQTVATEFFDTQNHVRCAPQPWSGGAVRCVPVVDDAVYADPACTTLVGLGRTISAPTHFVAYDVRPAGRVASRVFHAGAPTAPIAQYYEMTSGACAGPTAAPAGLMRFFEVGDEIDGGDLVEIHGDEIGDGRLGLQLRETDDGMRVPSGLRDRELDAACVPRPQADGSVACEPSGAVAATYFGDPACSEPVIAVGAAVTPTIARLVEPSGCASYHGIGREVLPPVYRRDGDTCAAVDGPIDGRLFAVAAAIAVPALQRSLEAVPGRRLQRIILDLGEDPSADRSAVADPTALRFVDDRLFDTTTGAECERRAFRDVTRCIPASIAATTLFMAGCTVEVRVAEVPQRTCQPVTVATSARPFQIRGIGELVAIPLFRADATSCVPYTGAPGTELRDLGPPIDPLAFMSAVYYGERAP